MKCVFLDFDGCIVTQSTLRNFPGYGHPDCVAALNYITDATAAKIVVSSTWRYDGLDTCREHLERWRVTGEVIDMTPLPEHIEACDIYLGNSRGEEIALWLSKHEPDVTSYVILDDDYDFLPHQTSRLVQTEFKYGLTMDHARMAVDILNG
jgi:hypothetical protein